MSKRPAIAPRDLPEADRLRQVLTDFNDHVQALHGLGELEMDALVAQILDSQKRQRYVGLIRGRGLTENVLDAPSASFDPIRGAIVCERNGNHDEACWLTFLSVHFGQHRRSGWQLAGDFYGRLGTGEPWNWSNARADVPGVRDWLDRHQSELRARGGKFGNHRKRESLSGSGTTGSGEAIQTYMEWVGHGTHADRFAETAPPTSSPTERFAALYESLRSVARFGRLARFDYLTMLGRIGLADVEPDKLHLKDSTGPKLGASLLLTGNPKSGADVDELEAQLAPLKEALGIGYDVLEDAICNWQKSPRSYLSFRG